MLDAIATQFEAAVLILNSLLTSMCRLLALLVISVGIVKSLLIFLKHSLLKPHTPLAFQRSRLEMGYSFSLGLSFLIGATILKTMISSQWEDIGRLAVIIGVRTLLNVLLERAISKSQALKE